MDPILEVIDQALRKKGLSDAAASKMAVGHPSLIKNMRIPRKGEKRYNLPALEKLADVLDLEFYFGPKLPESAKMEAQSNSVEFDDEARLVAAIEAVEDGLVGARRKISPHRKAQIIAVAYSMISDADDKKTAENNVISLLRAV